MMTIIRVMILLCLAGTVSAPAHEIRPAYLQIDETAPKQYEVFWKVPSRGDRVLDIEPLFDSALTVSKAAGHKLLDGFMLFRYRVSGGRGLPGTRLSIPALHQTQVDVLVNINLLDGVHHSLLLQPEAHTVTIPEVPSAVGVAVTYTKLGIEHILLGIDHLLFVLALLFLVGSWRRLIGTVTAFTLAHSLTLAAATLGWIRVPPAPVEAVIALSIVFVAVEILHARQGRAGLATRLPWVVAFVFGLLHGLGFASALREIGLPEHAIPLALAFFNVGVELGQLLFIAAVFVLLWLLGSLFSPAVGPRNPWRQAERLSVPAAYLVGSVAMFWVFERTYSFLV
jgi:hypothetical protein